MSSIEKKRSSAIKCVLFLFNLTASSQISIQLNTHTRAHTEKQKNIAGPQLEFLFLRGKKVEELVVLIQTALSHRIAKKGRNGQKKKGSTRKMIRSLNDGQHDF